MQDKKIVTLIDSDSLIHRAQWKNTFREAIVKLDQDIEDVIIGTYADKYRVAVKNTDGSNFRKDLLPTYKIHRNRSVALEHQLSALIRHLVKEWDAEKAIGQEADDLVVQWQREELAKGEYIPIIASIDKDLLTHSGTHYRMGERKIIYNTPEYAHYFFHLQLLMGDPGDGIKGLPGVGPVGAEKILEGVDPGAYRQTVIASYKTKFGKDWKEQLQLNGDLLFIRPKKGVGFII